MIKPILFYLSLFCLKSVYTQDYINYYALCNEADSLAYSGNNLDALKKYQNAFNDVEYVHSNKLINAYKLAIKIDSFSLAYSYGQQIIINSGKKEFINTQSRDFKKTEYFNLLNNSADSLLKIYNERVNHSYIKIIDSLIFIDQFVIRHNKEFKGQFFIDQSTLPQNLFDLDSSNWNFLFKCIGTMGFPSEKNVGYEAHEKVWAIIHHNLRLKENEKYHNLIFDFVKSGDYLPEELMVWYEQFYQMKYGQTFFTTWDGNVTKDNLERIDSNRRKFYLKGINSYELKKNGRFMIKKW